MMKLDITDEIMETKLRSRMESRKDVVGIGQYNEEIKKSIN